MSGAYTRFHVDKVNLAIHLVFVPVFAGSFALAVIFLVKGQLASSGRLLVVALLAFAIQAIGHRREAVPPEPFSGPVNFLQRIFAEQYFKFWRFLFGGEFSRAWRNGAP